MTPTITLAELYAQEVKGMTWRDARQHIARDGIGAVTAFGISLVSPDKLDQITDYALFGIPPSVRQREMT